jgi:hypothetical protein
MIKGSARLILLAFGWIFLSLGIIGAFLPIMPTTPFALLAAYCFSKSSPKLHQWILSRPVLGPLIKDWESSGIIRPRAKVMATLMMSLLFGYALFFVPVANWIRIIVASSGIAVLVFIWTRPSR